MSLVGPRRCLSTQIDVIAARHLRNVFSIRPGITGTAQLAAIDMSTPERLAQADSYYIEHRSFLGDLRILVATVLGGGYGDAVKRCARGSRRSQANRSRIDAFSGMLAA